MTLFDILTVWLESPVGNRKFHTDPEYDGLIRCSSCECFTAFINKDNLYLRLGIDYKRIMAADNKFFTSLAKHLMEHICT